jgi:predicted TIM-barrel fold metal-dependent hydrolase
MSSDVIDVDAHIRESNNDIRSYLPEPYCKRGSPLLASDGMWAGEGTNSDHSENPDITTRLSDMDREGISVAVLFPTNSLGMRRIIEPDYAVAYARAYNNYIADVCKQSSRIKGIALLPFIAVDEAIEELNRAITELGLSGVGLHHRA